MNDLASMHEPGGLAAPQPAGVDTWNPLLERLPIGVYICDRDGVVIQYNRKAADLWGRAPIKGDVRERFCGSHKLFLPDGSALPHDTCPAAHVLKTGIPFRDGEVVVERPDGTRIDALANIEPLFDEAGELVGIVNCFQDISELKRVQAEKQQFGTWVMQVVERSPVAMYWTDAGGRVMSYNKAAEVLWGRAPKVGEDLWCGSYKLYHPDGRAMPLDECPMAVALKNGQVPVANEALLERPDGSRGAFLAYPTLLHSSSGKLVGAVNMLVDISDRKRAEDRQKVLLDELNHRVKNTLASVQSLAAHSLRGAGDPRQMREDFEARLLALSYAHDQLAERRWEDADVRALAQAVLAPYGTGARVRLQGERAKVPASRAVTLCMALHELATNAAKYGALSNGEGRVVLEWTTEKARGGRRLVFEWREEGGPPVAPPSRRGFGTRFIEGAVASELGGRIEHRFDPDGVRCLLVCPI